MDIALLVGKIISAQTEDELPLIGFAVPETSDEVKKICEGSEDRVEYLGTLPNGNLSKLVCEDSAPLGQVITRSNGMLAEVIIWDWFSKSIRSNRTWYENGQLAVEILDDRVTEFYENGKLKRQGISGGIVEREWDVNGNLVVDNSNPTVRREKEGIKLSRETLTVGSATIKTVYNKGMLQSQQINVICDGVSANHTTFYSNGSITHVEVRDSNSETTTLYDRFGNPSVSIVLDKIHGLKEKTVYTSATDGVRLRVEGRNNNCYRFSVGKPEQKIDCAVFHAAK